MAGLMERGKPYKLEKTPCGFCLRPKDGPPDPVSVPTAQEEPVRLRMWGLPRNLLQQLRLEGEVESIEVEFVSGRLNSDYDRVLMQNGWMPLFELFAQPTIVIELV